MKTQLPSTETATPETTGPAACEHPCSNLFLILLISWTAVIGGSLIWSIRNIRNNITALAKTEARAAFQTDLSYRRWAAEHGGVYVPVTKKTQPNPYLKDLITEPTITTPGGQILTMVNPADMTRQVFERQQDHKGTQGHITSLQPLRPDNGPDPWERQMLIHFQKGTREAISVTQIDEMPFLRLMRPMTAEKSCLKCHADQGYKEGDLRGGISVSVPLTPYLLKAKAATSPVAGGHILIWLLGAAGLVAGNRITAQRARARRAAASILSQYQQIVSSTNDLLTLVTPQFTYLTGNDAYLTAMNVTRDELVGASVADILGEEMFNTVVRPYAIKCMTGQEVRHQAWRDLPARGRRHMDVVYSPYQTEAGEIDGFVMSARDITEIGELENKLRQAQKMEAVGQLAGGVAHDFNNLLQAMIGFSELARKSLAPEHRSYQHLGQVMAAGQRAKGLVRQLLAFSRKQTLNLEDLALSEVVQNFSKMILQVIGEDISLILHAEPEARNIHADRGQIEQILINLCVNAKDAMPEGGTITVHIQNTTLDQYTCNQQEGGVPGEYVLLRVADSGFGMEESTLKQIFEPFFTTKEIGRGTGLGLSTVYGIVRQHRGMISGTSEPGIGTEFKIYFPAIQPSASEPKCIKEPSGGTESILLAEDDAQIRELSANSLKEAGYTVLTAEDGEEAIRLLDEHPEQIAMAILDVIMPNLSGRAVYEHIQKTRPQTRVLFSSGYSETPAGTAFLQATGVQLLRKPYGSKDLLRSIRTILDS